MAEQSVPNDLAGKPSPVRLRDALRKARIEAADRTGVVVDLRDAEVARLEILHEALDSLFSEIPPGVDLFDRGISQGDTPRLWIDAVAHIAMGRDKRIYRFTQDTRFGRIVIAESHDIPVMVDAVTDYIARRMIEREHAMVVTPAPATSPAPVVTVAATPTAATVSTKRRSAVWTFAFGFAAGLAALFGFALVMALRGI
ncbi:MAG: hypothetical protein V4602_18860 [Pseudomonadota bacterium]